MMEGIGFYCGIVMRWFRDAFCELEKARGGARRRRRLRDPGARRPQRCRRAPTASSAIFSNLMQASRWVHASPGVRRLRRRRPGARRPRGVLPRDRGERRVRRPRPPRRSSRRSPGSTVDEARASPAAPRRAGCGRRSWPTCSGVRCGSRWSRSRPRSAPRSTRASAPASTTTRPDRRAARALRADVRAGAAARAGLRRSSTSSGSSCTGGRARASEAGLVRPLWRAAGLKGDR